MKKRSLFAAVAMLIVSAIVLTSATYAWFAASNQATVSTISATVTNADGSVLLVPTTWKATENGRGYKVQNVTGKSGLGSVAALTAPTTSLSDDNFDPFPGALNPVSFKVSGTGLTDYSTFKATYDSLNFTSGGAGSENGTVGSTTDAGGTTYTFTPGDFIHYGFEVQYKGVTGATQYVNMKPTLASGGPSFGYVLVRVQPIVKDTSAQANGQYKAHLGDVQDFWYAYDATGSVYPDSATKLYQPVSAITGSVADDKTAAADEEGAGADDYMADIVDDTDDGTYTLETAVLPSALSTSGQVATVSGSTFKVIDSGITYNDTYNAKVEVFIWAEGNDPQCSGSVTSATVGVGFEFNLV